MGVDWDKIVVAAMPHEARPAYSFLAGTWASDQKEARRPAYDPVKAKKLVAEVVAKAGKPLPVLNAIVSDLPLDVSIFELAKTQLMEIGINVDVKVYPWTLFYSKWNDPEATQWDLVIIPNKSGSPLINFSILRTGTRATKDGKNWSAYASPKLEEALERAEVTVESKESIQLFKEANRVALEDLPAFPTGLKIYYTGVQERVQDFKTHSAMIAISNPWTDMWLKK
jgi:ABC-type transport system substrate-binding protein